MDLSSDSALASRAEAISPLRARVDAYGTSLVDPVLGNLCRHWLFGANLLMLLTLAGAAAAPALLAAGADTAAQSVYDFYRAICHQWPFRSFFLFGPSALYGMADLEGAGVDPYAFVGSPGVGWKMAFCERDLGIFLGFLLFGIGYAMRWRALGLSACGYLMYGALIAPMAIDGLTQLYDWRVSTWELRVATGLLFGAASGWLLYPRFHRSFRLALG